MAQIIIRHPKTGHEIGIESGDFKRRKLGEGKDGKPVSYEDAGYRVVSHMDGSPFEQPAPKPEND